MSPIFLLVSKLATKSGVQHEDAAEEDHKHGPFHVIAARRGQGGTWKKAGKKETKHSERGSHYLKLPALALRKLVSTPRTPGRQFGNLMFTFRTFGHSGTLFREELPALLGAPRIPRLGTIGSGWKPHSRYCLRALANQTHQDYFFSKLWNMANKIAAVPRSPKRIIHVPRSIGNSPPKLRKSRGLKTAHARNTIPITRTFLRSPAGSRCPHCGHLVASLATWRLHSEHSINIRSSFSGDLRLLVSVVSRNSETRKIRCIRYHAAWPSGKEGSVIWTSFRLRNVFGCLNRIPRPRRRRS